MRGMTLDAATGAFSWTPTEAQGPGEFMVTFTAMDDGDPTADGRHDDYDHRK